jgi:hypothetical protein
LKHWKQICVLCEWRYSAHKAVSDTRHRKSEGKVPAVFGLRMTLALQVVNMISALLRNIRVVLIVFCKVHNAKQSLDQSVIYHLSIPLQQEYCMPRPCIACRYEQPNLF